MNERDYIILENTCFLFGIFTSFIMIITAFFIGYLELVNIYAFLLIPAIFGILIGIYFYIKRKQYVNEMLSYIKRGDKNG